MNKRTANRADIARMHKLAERGETLADISRAVQIDEDVCRIFMEGVTVRVSATDEIKTEVIGEKKRKKPKAKQDPEPAAAGGDPGFVD